MTRQEKIEEGTRLLRAAGAYAITWWTVEDVMQEADGDDFDAVDWLECNEDDIHEAMCEVGWRYIQNYITEE